jgi:hypothetical protein
MRFRTKKQAQKDKKGTITDFSQGTLTRKANIRLPQYYLHDWNERRGLDSRRLEND